MRAETSRRALVVLDLQHRVVAHPTAPHTTSEVVARSAALAEAFEENGLPVVLVEGTARAADERRTRWSEFDLTSHSGGRKLAPGDASGGRNGFRFPPRRVGRAQQAAR